MKIKVENIPEEGLNLQFSEDGSWFRDVLPEKEKTGLTLHRVDVFVSATRIGKTVSIELKIETAVDLECCRCLEVFTLPIKTRFKYTFVPLDEKTEEELELTSEDLSFGYYKDDVIELDPIIFEQIMLPIPMKPLCNNSCKGLCPHCGVNLNKVSCNCHTEVVDSRLAALKNFKVLKQK